MSKRSTRKTEKPDYVLYSIPVIFGFAILVYGISRFLTGEPASHRGMLVPPAAYILAGIALLVAPVVNHMIQKKKKTEE